MGGGEEGRGGIGGKSTVMGRYEGTNKFLGDGDGDIWMVGIGGFESVNDVDELNGGADFGEGSLKGDSTSVILGPSLDEEADEKVVVPEEKETLGLKEVVEKGIGVPDEITTPSLGLVILVDVAVVTPGDVSTTTSKPAPLVIAPCLDRCGETSLVAQGGLKGSSMSVRIGIMS
ncbi:hypothetical protein JR316_0007469 [Psilocybe cubensis]|uniref:Uncharacterized protein n=1 Tax=Psilocybe cubensis TaxID=181762 RepID=A0ACB8GZR5_PSICU|nr:hypothetical protein JR316_0007469 [Psilocybe cubensis]KAH9480867.1 hypothetical protein JR316_0007469 [Psilocybe cubensis]